MPPNQQMPTPQPLQPLPPNPSSQGAALPPNPGFSEGSGQPQEQPKKNPNTTQNSLLISELREGMAIMNDGSFRAVVKCQSINFDLMSAREREGVEYSYQNFLNSLYFPVQVLIRSQRVDIGPYIDRLAKIRRDQDNMLLGMLMDDYINFIDVLSQEANIMEKDFYVVVPYYPGGDSAAALTAGKNFFSTLFGGHKDQKIRIDKATYQKAKDEIQNRTSAVTSGLFQMGVKAHQLSTKELAELYYNMYNPDTAVREPLGDYTAVTSTYVQKGEGAAPNPNLEKEG